MDPDDIASFFTNFFFLSFSARNGIIGLLIWKVSKKGCIILAVEMKTWSFALVRGSLCAFWSTVNEEHFGTLTFGPAAICSKYFSIESQINIALSATLISSIQLVPQNWRGNVVQPVNSVTSCRLARDSLNKYQNDLSKHYIFQPVFFFKTCPECSMNDM